MKQFILSILICFGSFSSMAQDITGQWNGLLKIQGTQLRLVFNITADENGYRATMDSPDQGAEGIPVTTTTFENKTLTLFVESIRLTYQGRVDSDQEITGSFEQGGIELPLNLYREPVEPEINNRPQEPKEPFPYYSEDVRFNNKKAGVELAGTLTLPQKTGKFPVVILISGSGPQNRNEELMGHKPFLVLSDYLTRNGIAVLRYDDRGTAESTGDFSSATTYDLSTDTQAAIKFLKKRKEIDKKQIGLVGHSEGGIIAPMVASRCNKLAFIVLLAGTGIPGDQILLLQQRLIGEVSGIKKEELDRSITLNRSIFETIRKSENTDLLDAELSELLTKSMNELPVDQKPSGMSDEEYVKTQVDQITNPWMLYFLKHDPAQNLEKVKCPVLALNGSKDLQVPPLENLEAIEEALKKGGNSEYAIMELPNLNHLFQTCETGSPEEYPLIEETFSPIALEEILKWINAQIK